MQKTLLFIFLSLFISAQAQLDYSLTYSRSTYTELTGATNVSVENEPGISKKQSLSEPI